MNWVWFNSWGLYGVWFVKTYLIQGPILLGIDKNKGAVLEGKTLHLMYNLISF